MNKKLEKKLAFVYTNEYNVYTILHNNFLVSKKEKIKEKFLKSPETLSLKKILSFLLSQWYESKQAKWSHNKIIYLFTGEHIVIPVHNGDTKITYKKILKKFYIDNKEKYEN